VRMRVLNKPLNTAPAPKPAPSPAPVAAEEPSWPDEPGDPGPDIADFGEAAE